MSLLCDKEWKLKYPPDDGDLVALFYIPALECATRYDRLTGYFRARALALAARGIEGLVRNSGRMRLLVGCTLDQSPHSHATGPPQQRSRCLRPLVCSDPATALRV